MEHREKEKEQRSTKRFIREGSDFSGASADSRNRCRFAACSLSAGNQGRIAASLKNDRSTTIVDRSKGAASHERNRAAVLRSFRVSRERDVFYGTSASELGAPDNRRRIVLNRADLAARTV